MLGRALRIYAVVIAGGLALGPAIGGLLEGLLGWRSIFLVNIPMGVLSLIICYKIFERGESQKVKWDILGTILQFLTLFSTVYLLNYLKSNFLNIKAILLAFFSISTLILFLLWENYTNDPILNLSLFKNVSFSAYNLSMHLNYVCMYMVIFIMPFYLLKVLNLSPNTTGLVLTASNF
jgi:hypothetical protein